MYLGYFLPQIAAVGYVFTGGAGLLSNMLLSSRAPRSKTLFGWPSGTQTTSTNVVLTVNMGWFFVPKVAAILGMSVGAGQRITIQGIRNSDGATIPLGGNSLTQRTALMDDGTVGCYWVFNDGLAACKGYIVTMYNDFNGSTTIVASATVGIGQLCFSPAISFAHEKAWKQSRVPMRRLQRTLGGTVVMTSRPSYRTLSVKPAYGDSNSVRGNSLSGGTDWQTIIAGLAADPFCLIIEDGTTASLMQRSSFFGICSNQPGVDSLAGPNYQVDNLSFEEVPC